MVDDLGDKARDFGEDAKDSSSSRRRQTVKRGGSDLPARLIYLRPQVYQVHFCSELELHAASWMAAFSVVAAAARHKPVLDAGRIVPSVPKFQV